VLYSFWKDTLVFGKCDDLCDNIIGTLGLFELLFMFLQGLGDFYVKFAAMQLNSPTMPEAPALPLQLSSKTSP
jgi:hypothetical protein